VVNDDEVVFVVWGCICFCHCHLHVR